MAIQKPAIESSRAKAACDAYLALGPDRSLEKLYQTHTKPTPALSTFKVWSTTFDWAKRSTIYDDEQRERERAERERAESAERERRHKQRLADLDALRPIADEARELLAAIRLLKDPKDVLKFYEFIHKGERLEMGEATKRSELHAKVEQPIMVIEVNSLPRRPVQDDSGAS